MSVRSLKVWLQSKLDALPAIYRVRSCQGRVWKRRFPLASKTELRAFLRLFVEAFGFAPGHYLRFHPDDRPLEIYRHLYPFRWQPDALEFETLVHHIAARYSVRLEDLWHDDMTLGNLFASLPGAGRRRA